MVGYLQWPRKALETIELDLLGDGSLPGAPELGEPPHAVVGYKSFPMKQNLMRPYPGQDLDDETDIFNYRLSRVRRIMEIHSACLQHDEEFIREDFDNAQKMLNLLYQCISYAYSVYSQLIALRGMFPEPFQVCPSLPFLEKTHTQ